MKIGFFETEDWEKLYLETKLAGQELHFFNVAGNNNFDIEILSNFIGYPVTKEVLSRFPKLKYVTTRSTGYDHIDLAACAERGIMVSNVPTYGENTVAEFTFALLLALSRKIFPAVKRVREQGLFATDGLQGFDLQNKTLGVIGTGHIGTYVVKIAKGFGMNVSAYDPYPKPELAAQFGFSYCGLEELLKISDIVSLHVPYMPATHHLLNSQNIGLCKPRALIINTARGGLIETSALIGALKSGRLGGAGLDVLEEEGFVKDEVHMMAEGHPGEQMLKTALADHALMQMDNVLITPHNAFNSHEALIRILETTIANIESFALGKAVNVVK
ncbi:MAG: hydroxyacid dehydrogenase [Candidatus Doudnabacteria bacterium]|nr:hydroxyacid dehydrogenase [Candidatus Doudnabacteria bacterium]